MTAQFDLEQQILSCWRITDDLNVIYNDIVEGNMSNDDIADVLLGLQKLYDSRFDECFKTFEKYLQERCTN